jgi:glyoxylase-like metal-dependent hydrolase (beta-lactamase superfamily II)
MKNETLTRRELLLHSAVMGAGLTLGMRSGQAAETTPSTSKSSIQSQNTTTSTTIAAPSSLIAAYNFHIGKLQATVISDGFIEDTAPQPLWAPEAKPREFKAVLRSAFLPEDRLRLDSNILALRTGEGVVLIDSGAGHLFGPTVGRLARNLVLAGIDSNEVKGIIISHAHSDHVGGVFDANGEPLFPNATIYTTATEYEYWTKNPDLSRSSAPAPLRAKITTDAQTFYRIGKERLQMVKPGQVLFGVVELVAAPGHTPGHTVFLIGNGEDRLLHIVDTAHHSVLMLAHPEWSAGVDTDSPRAIATRRRVFAAAAQGRTRVMGYHFPFPGIGHIRPQKGGYQWVPEPMLL